MDGKSLNIAEDKIQQLKQLFPEVFAEDKIDFDKLKLILGEETLAKEERYELNWAGKYNSFKEIQKQTTATLIPDPENSIDFDTSENIFIEGENLEALRVLQKSYYGKIKMIYIDPPYNTGNDSFVYPDDYTERRSEYEERTGIKDEDGFLNKQDLWKKNTKENGQFHSVWLSMMYPRLFLARNLMREDGVIFVSIDDNEVDNLKLLMDMVFGEENFIGNFVWKRRASSALAEMLVSKDHEYVLSYQKTYSSNFKGISKDYSAYKNPDKDPRGAWTLGDLTVGMNKDQRPNQFYTLVNPKTGLEYPPNDNRVWAYIPESMNKLIKENRVYFPTDNKKRPMLKRFQNELKSTVNPFSTWMSNVGLNSEGTKIIQSLFKTNIFNYTKPISLITQLVEQTTDKDDIILDFFAGSSTTAQSILELNQKDDNNRNFIMVQMPESLGEKSQGYQEGYKTLSQISQARIKKVIEKIKAEQEGKLDFGKDHPQDLGFKSFKLAPSNFKTWRSDAEGEALAEQLALFQSPYKEGTEQENMLYELLLKAGFPLTVPIQKENVEGIALYIVDGGKMLLSLEAINEKVLDYVLEVKPQRFVTLDKLFGKDDQLLTNTRLQLQEMGVDFQVI